MYLKTRKIFKIFLKLDFNFYLLFINHSNINKINNVAKVHNEFFFFLIFVQGFIIFEIRSLLSNVRCPTVYGQ